MTRRWGGSLAAVLVLGLGAGCSGSLDDEATCPGTTCTDDVRERVEVIGDLDGVTEVEQVMRRYSFDRGSYRSAEVRTQSDRHRDHITVGLAVLEALATWPDQAESDADVTIHGPGRDTLLVLRDEWVCEAVGGTIRACTEDNSWLVTGEKVTGR